jgi:primary-amine oxidase
MTRAALLLAWFGLQNPPDPLDPLTAAEIVLAREVLERSGHLGPAIRFATLALREPPKDAVMSQRRGAPMGRTAEAILFDWATSTGVRAHVDLRRGRLIRWDTLPSREPPMRVMVRRRLEEVVRADPRWSTALARRGIADQSLVSIIPSLRESAPLPWEDGRRIIRGAGFHQEAMPLADPARGIGVRVDLTRGTLLELREGSAPPAPLDSLSMPMPETPGRDQPAAPGDQGFTIEGTRISWKQWRLRFGVHPRRGLELWEVVWVENGRARSVLYRASISEAMAAYGDPGYSVWYPRDAGNDGLGNVENNAAVPLGDAPVGARFADAVIADDLGRPATIPRAVAVYQRDGGLLWRHSRQARRATQLVLSSHATIDNYDFTFNWILGEDGSIEAEVNLTGLMLVYPAPSATAGAGHSGSSHLVAPGVLAPTHQHFFSYRLDFDVDEGGRNRVVETDNASLRRRRRGNPLGLWFTMEERPLSSEAGAIREPAPAAGRSWRVINPDRLNSLGLPVGYAVVPGVSAMPYAHPASPMRKQAGFVNAQLFVTPFRRDELYAAGEFQNYALEEEGLTRWTRADRNLLDTDVVLWYTVGVTHLPRPEEFPVMPVARAGFRMIPWGFFGRNPALGAGGTGH